MNPKIFEIIVRIIVEAGRMVLESCFERKAGSGGKKSTARKKT
jgi:hypothetical protein